MAPDRVHRFRHVTDVLLEAGYACAWIRYRTEVVLGYQTGGPMRTDVRQGMGLTKRAPLEYEVEVAVLPHVAEHPAIDADNLLHLGVSDAGEMLFKLCSQYDDCLEWGCSRTSLARVSDLGLDNEPTVESVDGLRNIESLEIRSTERAQAWVTDPDEVSRRLDRVDIPVLVLGREQDELLGSSGSPTSPWRRSDRMRSGAPGRTTSTGYIYPETGADGAAQVDDVQREALAVVLDFLDRHRR